MQRLAAIAPAVDRRARVLDHDPRRCALQQVRHCRRDRVARPPPSDELAIQGDNADVRYTFRAMNYPAPAGIQLHITSLPGGRLGPEAHRIRRLARRRRPDVVAGPAARPARPSPLSIQGELGVRRVARAARRSPRARVRPPRSCEFRDAQRFWIDDWERFAGRGAVADQVRFEREWARAAGLCGRARRADHG